MEYPSLMSVSFGPGVGLSELLWNCTHSLSLPFTFFTQDSTPGREPAGSYMGLSTASSTCFWAIHSWWSKSLLRFSQGQIKWKVHGYHPTWPLLMATYKLWGGSEVAQGQVHWCEYWTANQWKALLPQNLLCELEMLLKTTRLSLKSP